MDAEAAGSVEVPERRPQARGLDEQVHSLASLELVVLARVDVAGGRVGDGGVDVERRGPGRPVSGALLTADRPPWEGGSALAEDLGSLAGQRQRRVPPAQHFAGRGRRRVRQHRQHEGLRVPERVSVVARAGQALGGDRTALRTDRGLMNVEQREPYGLLELRISVDLDVRAVPVVVELLALFGCQLVPAGQPGGRERALDLIPQGRRRATMRPAVREELDQAELAPALQPGGDGQPGQIVVDVHGAVDLARSLEDVVGAGRYPQPRASRFVYQDTGRPMAGGQLRHERSGEAGAGPRVRVRRLRARRLGGQQIGLHGDVENAVERLDLVGDRRDGAAGERHQPLRRHPDGPAGRRDPLRPARHQPGPEVEALFVRQDPAVAQVERGVADDQPDDLPVGDVDDRLARLRESIADLRMGERPLFEEPVEVAAGDRARLAFVEGAAQPDMTVGEGEDRLELGDRLEVEAGDPKRPRLDEVVRVHGRHADSSSSARSATTMSAPRSRSASAWPARSTPTT